MKPYRIEIQRRNGYATMIIRNRETGAAVAEYRVEIGRERAEVATTRRTIDRHLANPGATLGNYQW